jgi:hypothetical protein
VPAAGFGALRGAGVARRAAHRRGASRAVHAAAPVPLSALPAARESPTHARQPLHRGVTLLDGMSWAALSAGQSVKQIEAAGAQRCPPPGGGGGCCGGCGGSLCSACGWQLGWGLRPVRRRALMQSMDGRQRGGAWHGPLEVKKARP